jgi:L-ascorbate metabolism protein UlaG (beta-lactamase superfamily)
VRSKYNLLKYTKYAAIVVVAMTIGAVAAVIFNVAGNQPAIQDPELQQETAEVAESFQTHGVVKVTPLGSHAGEFCSQDRAILFEDPTGVRILWDPGFTVDETDSRLGDVHAIVISHSHGDHIGSAKPNPQNPGTCVAPGLVSAAPNTSTAAIAAVKNSAVVSGGELPSFFSRKIQNIRSVGTPGCPSAGLNNEMTVPRTAPCTGSLQPGASRTIKMTGATAGVMIALVPATHTNGIGGNLIEEPGIPPGLSGYGGPPHGAILKFTNGLTAYLGGDTGFLSDMSTIIRGYYRANLAVINMGNTFTLGPDEAAFATKTLIKPRTVIPSHSLEASTTEGIITGLRLARFKDKLDHSRVHIVVPLSGITREFNGRGECINCP